MPCRAWTTFSTPPRLSRCRPVNFIRWRRSARTCLALKTCFVQPWCTKTKRCVVLSMGKAVYPVKAMGMSKALMGAGPVSAQPVRKCHGLSRVGHSAFPHQSLQGKPLTIMTPMTRFLMSLDEFGHLDPYATCMRNRGTFWYRRRLPLRSANWQGRLGKSWKGGPNEGDRHAPRRKTLRSPVSREEMGRVEDLGVTIEDPPTPETLTTTIFRRGRTGEFSAQGPYFS